MLRVINSVELSAEPKRHVKLAVIARHDGHPQVGTQDVTPERAASIAEQFRLHYAANNAALVVDYNHSTILALRGLCRPDEAVAAGWIRQVELEGGEPFGDVEWTANADAKIRAGEFRYLSPVFEFDVPDRKTGATIPCRLHSVALTNKPFLTELPAVANAADAIASLYGGEPEHTRPRAFVGFACDLLAAQGDEGWREEPAALRCIVNAELPGALMRHKRLVEGLVANLAKQEERPWTIRSFAFDAASWPPERARQWLAEHDITGEILAANTEIPQVDTKELARLVGLADDATEDACKAALAEWKTKVEAPVPLVAANVAELLDVPADATLDAIKERVEKLAAKPDAADPAFEHVAVANGMGLTSDATLDQMLARLAELNGAVVNSDAELLVGKAVADGKIPPADKARWIAEAKRDQAATAKLIANMAPLVGRTAAAHKPADDGLPELTAEEERLCKLCGNDPMAVRKAKAARGG